MAESTGESKITWNVIALAMKGLIKKITDMKFEMPRQPEEHFRKVLNVALYEEVIAAFRTLAEEK